jgi:hypothetical protein
MADENLERFKRGAFLSLKAAALTEPKHNAKYNEI